MERISIALALTVACLQAQWIKQPTPGIPRTADGKPNLTAPAPRTPEGKPDFSGMWQPGPSPYPYFFDVIQDPKDESIFRPAAEALFKEYDRDKKGKLGEKEIAKAMNRLGTSPENAPGVAGPDLGNVGHDPAHTVDWFKAQIRGPKSHKPKARMPSFEGKIKDDDLNALAEFLASLK